MIDFIIDIFLNGFVWNLGWMYLCWLCSSFWI